MAYRWLSLGLTLQLALASAPAIGGDCARPNYYSAPQTASYAAPQTSYYATPQTAYYSMPQTAQYVVPQTTQYVASYAAPMTYAPAAPGSQGASPQSSAQSCAEPSSQSALLAGILPLLIPRLIDRMFPDAPPAAPPATSDVNARLTKIETRLDKLEVEVFKNGAKNTGKKKLDPVPPPGSARNSGSEQIIKGIAQIQETQAKMANQLISLDGNIRQNAADMKKIESFLISKYEDEYRNHEPNRD